MVVGQGVYLKLLEDLSSKLVGLVILAEISMSRCRGGVLSVHVMHMICVTALRQVKLDVT